MIKKYKEYLIAPFITVLIVLIIYLIKGIYPFGNMTIASGDLGQSSIPMYYYLYDVCSGVKSIFFNYDLGMGSNMYGGFILSGFFNPSCYIILLNSRDNIPYMTSYILLIKFTFLAYLLNVSKSL